VESEQVADQPEVELRILTPPPSAKCQPQVVAVTFPANWPVDQAKTFIYRELQESCLQPAGGPMRWSQDGSAITLQLGGPTSQTLRVTLEEGVQEQLEPGSGRTEIVVFDRAAGWTWERAEQWVAGRLGLRDLGRTCVLTTMHRAQPDLAGFLLELFFCGNCELPHASPTQRGIGPAVEFVAVPSLPAVDDGHKTRPAFGNGPSADTSFAEGHGGSPGTVAVKAPRLRAIKGGAGLEIDLAANRPLEHLPADLRAALPRHGLVNYLEARAVVATLERLLADPDFQDAAAHWQAGRAAPCRQVGQPCRSAAGEVSHCPTVAVMALYPAQAELLRLLLRQSAALTSSPWAIEVGMPSAFRQRECLAALVSLTRSHTHRAVSYGEGPQSLAEACTRAADRLILFGDPATLARRTQWQGALDHLDEPTAQAERGLAARLVACIQGHGPFSRALHVREGGGV
jgi:hypothetical protein